MVCTLWLATIATGCKHVRVPQSPALARGPVKDLAAIRAGNQLSLFWTMPSKHIRALVVHGSIAARICRRQSVSDDCKQAGDPLRLAPGANGTYTEMLPAELAAGPPRLFYYSVEILDRNGQSTGLSNSVATLAGTPLPALRGFTAERTERGVVLHWEPDPLLQEPPSTLIRIHRVQLGLASLPVGNNLSPPVSSEKDLHLSDSPQLDHDLDTDVLNGNTYEYRAQRVVQIIVNGQTLELAGEFSVPARAEAVSANQK